MNTHFPNISVKELFSGFERLPAAISGAKAKAGEVLSLGALVRTDVTGGHSNNSLTSTAKGTISTAQGMVQDMACLQKQESETGEPFFGQHFRETYSFFRNVFRRKQ
jgi:hypothetical protein